MLQNYRQLDVVVSSDGRCNTPGNCAIFFKVKSTSVVNTLGLFSKLCTLCSVFIPQYS